MIKKVTFPSFTVQHVVRPAESKASIVPARQ